MKTMAVDLCCNDPDNGMALDKIDAIEVHLSDETDYEIKVVDFEMSWEVQSDRNKRIKLGDRIYPIHGYREWYGNWCWNRIWMAPADVVTLLNYLVSRHKHAHCEDSFEWATARFETKGSFTLADLERYNDRI